MRTKAEYLAAVEERAENGLHHGITDQQLAAVAPCRRCKLRHGGEECDLDQRLRHIATANADGWIDCGESA